MVLAGTFVMRSSGPTGDDDHHALVRNTYGRDQPVMS
jgi:hypothetical protein